MRLLSRALIVCLLATSPVLADESNPEKPSTVERVRAAWRVGNEEALAELARRDEPDPWTVADDLCLAGDVDAALAFARAAVRPDTARLADYLERRGTRAPDVELRAAVREGESARTKEEHAKALERLDAVLGRGDAFEQTLVHATRGNVLVELERYEEAGEAYLSAGRTAERLGWLSVASQAYQSSGEAAYLVSHADDMLTAWESRLGVEEGRGNEAAVAEALMFVGLVHSELGDPDTSLQYLKEAEAAQEALGNDDGLAWVLNNLATIHDRRGEYRLEQEALERALELARKVGNKVRIAAVLCDMGALNLEFHRHDKARELLDEAMTLHTELGDDDGVNQCLGLIGMIYDREGEYDKALEYYEPTLAHWRKIGDKAFECAAVNAVGYAYFKKGMLDRAQELEEEAVRVGEELSDPWWVAHARQSLAEILLKKKDYGGAKRQLERSLTAATRLASPHLLMIAHGGLAELRLAQGSAARAVHHSRLALEQIKELYAGLGHLQAASARDEATPIYDVATRAAVAWGRPAAVFTAMESARSGALLEVLENREEIRAVRIPEALRTREREAKHEALTALRSYQRAMEKGDLRDVKQRRAVLERARGVVDEVIAQIQRVAKSPASVLYPEAATLEEVQRELAPGDAMVIYSLVGEEALALVVTRESAKAVSLGPRDAITKLAADRPEDPSVDRKASIAALRKALVAPLALPKTSTRLLISPDGVLGFMPFSLLAPGLEVVYVPSGTAYRILRQASSERGRGVLALGDPDYRPRLDAEPRVAVRGGMQLVPLPATREEAKRIGDVVLLGRRATKTALLAALKERPRWEAVHLACHGLVDPARPARSALALAFEPGASNLLRCEEVFTKRIPADLTVLSACETGRGAVYRSEGIVGLAQAFMLAGSPRVLVSLWKVDDDATRELMLAFYDAWRPKDERPARSAAEALVAAQAHVRAQAKWSHPYYWAAWVLWGLP